MNYNSLQFKLSGLKVVYFCLFVFVFIVIYVFISIFDTNKVVTI